MKWLREYIKNKPNHVLSVATVLCFIQFISNIFTIFRTGVFDSNTLNHLMSSADGFETVVLCVIMLALKDKNK
jgi:hypothetical protein